MSGLDNIRNIVTIRLFTYFLCCYRLNWFDEQWAMRCPHDGCFGVEEG